MINNSISITPATLHEPPRPPRVGAAVLAPKPPVAKGQQHAAARQCNGPKFIACKMKPSPIILPLNDWWNSMDAQRKEDATCTGSCGECVRLAARKQHCYTPHLDRPSSSGVDRPSSSMVGFSCVTTEWYRLSSCALSLMPSKMRTDLRRCVSA